MNILDIITKKSNGEENSPEEIQYLINNYVENNIPDYQMSAWLMAIKINGMNDRETLELTKIILNSGTKYSLDNLKNFKIDKHSTGGIGDKVSLILSPILAAFGLDVTKISGRSLGYTGGTIDKLESFKNFKTDITYEKFISIINECHMSIIAQSKDLVPADKKLYALRDVTGTVNSVPLIVSSIMSKKLAIESDLIVIDIKVGPAANVKNLAQAEELARIMKSIAKAFNRKIIIYISDMTYPLGRAIGNAVEIYEVIRFLQGSFLSDDLYELILNMVSDCLIFAKKFSNKATAKAAIVKKIKELDALNVFKQFLHLQGASMDLYEKILNNDLNTVLNTKNEIEITAKSDGYVSYKSSLDLAKLVQILGANRIKKSDKIDHFAGIYLNKKNNEQVKKGDTVLTFYTNRFVTQPTISKAEKLFEIKKTKSSAQSKIHHIIK